MAKSWTTFCCPGSYKECKINVVRNLGLLHIRPSKSGRLFLFHQPQMMKHFLLRQFAIRELRKRNNVSKESHQKDQIGRRHLPILHFSYEAKRVLSYFRPDQSGMTTSESAPAPCKGKMSVSWVTRNLLSNSKDILLCSCGHINLKYLFNPILMSFQCHFILSNAKLSKERKKCLILHSIWKKYTKNS